MILSGIELHGFKSFAERTTFTLVDGVTCFVGPNGCGKSNLVDALKWALGEQRPTSLRGSEMADVIFKGNTHRGPCHAAEVRITFRNGAQQPHQPKLPLDYEEVQITRRLHGTGESEYELNGTPCRLRDIRDLLLDTGVGVSAYSFMEQGKIDAILSVNPLDRRAVLEEAAGVSKYRARRRETLRKLERVEQDLLRAGDLIQELERQVRSLKQQAGRARTYQAASQRLKEIASRHSQHAYLTLDARRSALRDEKRQAQEHEQAVRHSLEELEARVQEAEERDSLLGEELATARAAIADLKAQSEAAESRVKDLQAREVELRQAIELGSRRRSELDGVLAEREAARAVLVEESDRLLAALDRLRQEVDEVRAIEEEAAGEVARLEQEIASSEALLEGLLARRDELRGGLIDLQSDERNLNGTRARGIGRQNELAAAIADLRGGLREACERLEHKRASHVQAVEELDRCREERSRVESQLRELQRDDDRLAATRLARVSRSEVLEGLLRTLEGVDEGVRVLLDATRDSGSGVTGVRGLLADLVRADLDDTRALEAALGPLAQALVVNRCDDAVRALRFLKERKVGRVTLIPLEEFADTHTPIRRGERRLLDRVRFDPELWPLFEALLGDVDLVPDLTGLAEATRGGATLRLVTPEGDLRELGGPLSGGGREGERGLISRRSELEAIEQEIREIDVARARLAEQMRHADLRRAELEGEEQRLGENLATLGETLEDERRRAASLLDRLELLREELRVTLLELVVLDRDRAEVRAKRREVALRLQACETEEAETRSGLSRLRETQASRARHQTEAAERRRVLELEQIRTAEREEAARRQIASVDQTIRENRADLARLHQGLQGDGERLIQIAAERALLNESLRQMIEERARLGRAMEQMQATLEGVRHEVATFRESVKARHQDVEQAASVVHEVEMREQRTQLELDALIERTREELEIDLSVALLDFVDDPASDWEALDAEIRELRAKLARMGGVNLEAIEELEGVEERLTFMTTQRDDLVRSRRSLMQMIEEIDRESTTRFQQTFEQVRDHFRAIFRKLFQGGQADIQLTEGDEIMDAGVEILAAPPGKRQQSITLLSGGERTLTAVALLFALFKTKPSPVCVLDEVDAALDECNIERFCSMLDEFEKDSQFLIVTHSKRTMARGRVLYGITMEGDGVSRPIALEMGDDGVARAVSRDDQAGMVA
ncbi:MAG: chromosome segregation protein SMC [Planctomycetota bacterium]